MPSVKRFYNGGDKFEDVLLFSKPQTDSSDNHPLGRKYLVFPKQSFIEIDDEMEIGIETVRGNFAADLTRRHGPRGLVLVDPKHDPAAEDPEKDPPAKAPTDALAIERGAKLWHEYTMRVVEHHLNDCESALGAGGAPRAARDFTKHCLKLHGIKDPADRYRDSLKDGAAPMTSGMDATIAAMQQQMAQTNTLLIALLSGEKLDKETLKQLLTTGGSASPIKGAGKPVVSGIATGTITKPVSNESGYDTLAQRPERQKELGIQMKPTGKARDAKARGSDARKFLEQADQQQK